MRDLFGPGERAATRRLLTIRATEEEVDALDRLRVLAGIGPGQSGGRSAVIRAAIRFYMDNAPGCGPPPAGA